MKTIRFHNPSRQLAISTPASAQIRNTDKRVDRLEQEMRAVQRKVFPAVPPAFSNPKSPAEADPASPTTSTTSAVTDSDRPGRRAGSAVLPTSPVRWKKTDFD